MRSYSCPVCDSEDIVFATGPQSPILLVWSIPTDEDIKRGHPFQGSVEGVLRTEFSFYRIDIHRCRMTSLWIHPKAKGKKNKNADCLKYSTSEVIKEAKGKKLVVLFGAEAVKQFTGYSVDNASGLLLKSNYFSAPVIAMENPLSMLKRGGVVGEVRLAIRKICEYIEKEHLL